MRKPKANKRTLNEAAVSDENDFQILDDEDIPAFESVQRPPKKKARPSNRAQARHSVLAPSSAPHQVPKVESANALVADGANDEDDSQAEGPDGGERSIRFYFHPGVVVDGTGGKSYSYRCRHCPKARRAGRTGTWNLKIHQASCTGLEKSRRENAPGIIVTPQYEATYQSRLNTRTGALVKAFDPSAFTEKIVHWVASYGLAFTIVEFKQLQEAFGIANPAATLPSADTVTRHVESAYDMVCQTISTLLAQQTSTIHYAHDAWTDGQR